MDIKKDKAVEGVGWENDAGHTKTYRDGKQEYVEKMGLELGVMFYELWQDLVRIHRCWGELIVLFGTNKRVELLNSVSPNFFKLIHDILWEYTILGLARITDGAQTGCGKKVKKNLSIKAMKRLLSPEAIEVSDSIFSKVEKSVEFCRDWRNKHIAHRDLYYILQSPKQLKATRKEVEATMSDIAAVMNAVAQCYQVPPTMFDFCIGADSTSLLSYLDIGRRCSDERWKRLKNGLATPADYKLHSI